MLNFIVFILKIENRDTHTYLDFTNFIIIKNIIWKCLYFQGIYHLIPSDPTKAS